MSEPKRLPDGVAVPIVHPDTPPPPGALVFWAEPDRPVWTRYYVPAVLEVACPVCPATPGVPCVSRPVGPWPGNPTRRVPHIARERAAYPES